MYFVEFSISSRCSQLSGFGGRSAINIKHVAVTGIGECLLLMEHAVTMKYVDGRKRTTQEKGGLAYSSLIYGYNPGHVLEDIERKASAIIPTHLLRAMPKAE
nr:hypothetical protein CFP56_52743 [Quercus suber]